MFHIGPGFVSTVFQSRFKKSYTYTHILHGLMMVMIMKYLSNSVRFRHEVHVSGTKY